MSTGNTSKIERSRLEWVDYAKGIAIILVVYRHALYGIKFSGIEVKDWLMNANEIVYSFRMPLFFILSGFFVAKSISKRNSFKTFTKYKFSTILYPYFIWGIIQITIQIVLTNYTNSSRTIHDFISLFLHPRAIDQLWYLYALFNVSILFFIIYSILKLNNYWMILLSLILFGLSVFVTKYGLLHDSAYFLLFFVLGHLTQNLFTQEKNYRFFYSYKPLLLVTPIFFLSQYYWLNNREMNIYFFAAIALIGVLFTFMLSIILHKHKYLKILSLIGKHSLQIYLMHVLIIAATRIILMKVFKIQSIGIILITGWILGTFIPVIFYKTIGHKYFKLLFSLEKKSKT